MNTALPLPTYDLSQDEIAELETGLAKVAGAGLDPGADEFYEQAWVQDSVLPAGLRGFLRHFRSREPAAACLVRGLPVPDSRVCPTPRSWRDAAAAARTLREESHLALVASAMGEVFSWSTLQEGRLVCDVLPIEGEESQQSGHGQVLLEWHTEDGFHPQRCHYLLLFGVRNHDRVPTTLASVRDVRVPAEYRRILSERRFLIVPDDEHLRQLAQHRPDHPGLTQMRRMRDEPEPVAVLFGDMDLPYLRIDPYFMRPVDGDPEVAAALTHLMGEPGPGAQRPGQRENARRRGESGQTRPR